LWILLIPLVTRKMISSQTIIISFWTITRKEVVRFLRIWTQTLLPSVITSVLYFLIFGQFIGDRIGAVEGVSYMEFIVPGLVMLAMITNAFSNVVSSFFGAKFMHNIEEIMVSPTPPWVMVAGFTIGGVLRGLMVGALVLIVSLFFTEIQILHPLTIILFAVITCTLFSFGGMLNGLFARKFDDVAIVPTFVLTPLIYLGGIFYSIEFLPPFWREVSYLNPMVYLVNGFRYGFSGVSDVPVQTSLMIVFLVTIATGIFTVWVIRKGIGLKN